MSAAATTPDSAIPTGEPRRLTAARLYSELTRDPRFAMKFRFHTVIPHGAEPTLRALCKEIAASVELGVYRPTAADAPAELASQMRKTGAERQIAADLACLMAAGVVMATDDGAFTLPLDFEELIRPIFRAPDAAGLASDVNWRPRGCTEEEWEAKSKKQKQDAINGKKGGRPPMKAKRPPGQGELLKPKLVEPRRNPDGSHHVPDSETQGGSNPKPSDSVGFVGSGDRVGQSTLEEAAAAENRSILQQQQQQAGVRAGETHGGETQNPAPQNPSLENPGAQEPTPSDEAVTIAWEFAEAFGIDPVHAAEAPGIMQRYLNEGYAAATIRQAIAKTKGRKVRGARYLVEPLAGLAPGVLAKKPSPTGSASDQGETKQDEHPGIAAEPTWAGLPQRERADISGVLRVLEMPPSQERWRLMDAKRAVHKAAFDRVAALRPGAQAILDAGPDGWRREPKAA